MEKTIESCLAEDYKSLIRFFRNFQILKRTDYTKARESFRNFKFGLQRHIIWEEEILFPVFEEKTNLKNMGPTFDMCHAHRDIKDALEALHRKVQKNNPDSDREEAVLIDILERHKKKEGDIIHPLVDELTEFSEREDIFLKMESVSEKRYKTCCGSHLH